MPADRATMEKRQRIMVIVVVALGLIGLVTKAGPWLLEPLLKEDKKLLEYQRQYKKAKAKLAQKEELRKRYRTLAKRTLALSEKGAGTALHAQLQAVAAGSRLGKPQIDQTRPRTYKDEGTGARMLAMCGGVKGQGSVQNVVDFLGAFYELPYAMQIRQITLSPSYPTKGSMYVMADFNVEALVLPPNRLVGKDPVETAPLNPTTRPKDKRMKRDNMAAYSLVASKNVFEPTIPPPPKPAKKDDKKRRPPQRPGRKGRDPRPDTKLVVLSRYPWIDPVTGQEHLIQEVTTRDVKTKENRIYRFGDTFDEGSLIYVDSAGAVVRKGGQELWYYPAGKALTDCERLDPELHPDQHWAVQQLEGLAVQR